MKYIIGLQIGITSGCAVYFNNKIVYAASEERFTKIKNDTSFPVQACMYAIKEFDLNDKNIEKILLVSQTMSPDHFVVSRESSFSIDDYVYEQNMFYKEVLLSGNKVDYLDVFSHKLDKRYEDLIALLLSSVPADRPKIWNDWRISKVSKLFGVNSSEIQIINHELSHAAYAYYGAPYRDEDTAIITFDGFGDSANCLVAKIEDSRIKVVKKYSNFNVGRIYRYITLLLGMKPSEHEFKVMGLAPYSTSYNYRKPLDIFNAAYDFDEKTGDVICDKSLSDHYFYFKEKLDGCRFDGIAGALQIFTETISAKLVKFWMKKLAVSKLVLSGGVSLNIKSNLELSKLDCVKSLFVPGSGGDESLCIGCIYAYLDAIGKGYSIESSPTMYLGPSNDNVSVEQLVNKLSKNNKYNVSDYDSNFVANQLVCGSIFARCSGRMEFGARSLGNRAIIADPRNRNTIDKINAKVKNRDFWMPFTPSILSDDATTYLDNPKGLDFPYMSVACESTERCAYDLQAAIHPADKTIRPQIVSKCQNPSYYDLIEKFKQLSGVGALLNTSLNLHGFPIAMTPEDAFYFLDNSDLDGLILENYFIKKVRDN